MRRKLMAVGVLVACTGAAACASTGISAETSGGPGSPDVRPTVVPGAAVQADPGSATPRKKVLFVRGAPKTAGVDGGPNDVNLSDILGRKPQGFDNFSATLAQNGYDVFQIEEGPQGEQARLVQEDLAKYAVVVFGSNNAAYDDASATALDTYVRNGGGVLLFQDKNYGLTDTSAALSDESLVAQYGVELSRDDGKVASYGPPDQGDWSHPLFDGVAEITGYGATSFSVVTAVSGVSTANLVPAKNGIIGKDAGAVERAPQAGDAAILAIEAGDGRIVCHFDRDTFFNDNVTKPGNKRYTLNLFRWLAGD